MQFCLTGAAIALPMAADAQPRREPRYAHITVESRYGAQTASGPVRRGPQGRLEVRLPGGTWIECGGKGTPQERRRRAGLSALSLLALR